ncbi:MAG: aminopeptidase, partial [Candidatus Thorarchaeota archaeon]|nr:aminopeptidase [Candidatus Thorarchaeota archaeon]
MDPRTERHAEILVKWSAEVRPGDMVIVRASPESHTLAIAVAKHVSLAGGKVLTLFESEEIQRATLENSSPETLEVFPKHVAEMYKAADVIINLSAPMNTRTLTSVDPKRLIAVSRVQRPIQDTVLSKRWVLTVHPCRALAQQANMSLEEYEDFVYGATLIDWAAESKNLYLVKEHLERHSDVRFVGPETDLYARTDGRVWIASDGKKNMPSGEVFTAPIEDTVEGTVYFDIPFVYQGRVIEGVRLRFEKGE